ncbi:hypothetical protein E2C01_030401 [Portunus trituberculatus]|uniref:Uncharacterized protein n=1 Tax=Portunus trituberculatus TaxID=210409 RepID=A0A5B7ERZ3_PORTR|nr:hypothetical protein [Portunus trituberculatus]
MQHLTMNLSKTSNFEIYLWMVRKSTLTIAEPTLRLNHFRNAPCRGEEKVLVANFSTAKEEES